MNNKSLKSILDVAEKHGYKATFILRHIADKMDKEKVSLGDRFISTETFGEMLHEPTKEVFKLKGSYIAFDEFIPADADVELLDEATDEPIEVVETPDDTDIF